MKFCWPALTKSWFLLFHRTIARWLGMDYVRVRMWYRTDSTPWCWVETMVNLWLTKVLNMLAKFAVVSCKNVVCVTETSRPVASGSCSLIFQQVMLQVVSHPHSSTNRIVMPFTSWPIGVLYLVHIPKMIQKQGKCGIMAPGRWLRFGGIASVFVQWMNALYGITFWRTMCNSRSLRTKKLF